MVCPCKVVCTCAHGVRFFIDIRRAILATERVVIDSFVEIVGPFRLLRAFIALNTVVAGDLFNFSISDLLMS